MSPEERRKKRIIFFEIVKRVLIVAFVLGVIVTALGWIDLPLARHQLMNSEQTRQLMADATGINDIKIKHVKFVRYKDSDNKLYLTYITPASESMAAYADAEEGSTEARQLLRIMRKVCAAVNREDRLFDTIEPRHDIILSPPYEFHAELIAGSHKVYYKKGTSYAHRPEDRLECLKIDDKIVYTRQLQS